MKYNTLAELFDKIVKSEFNKESIDKLIYSDENCVKFMRKQLKDEEISMPTDADVYDLAKTRAQHSVVTYLMGKVLLNYYKEYHRAYSRRDDIDMIERLWLLTSLYHDIGYTSEFLKRSDFNFEKEFKNDYLLSRGNYINYNKDKALAYTYDEVENYSEYRRVTNVDKKNVVEKIDHGILGGCLAFRKVMRAYRSVNIQITEKDIEDNKIFCMTIAQHNIFKSDSRERDKEYIKYNLYRLLSDSNFKVNKRVPLLLLLSLVDTIECVKKFSKSRDSKEPYIQALTVIKNIKVGCDGLFLYIDYTDLHNYCTAKGMKEKYQEYMHNIEMLSTWTVFNVEKVIGKDDVYRICLI